MNDSIDNKNAELFIKNVKNHNIENDTDFLISKIFFKNKIKILDIGYGTGKLLSKMRDQSKEINLYGVEKSKILYEYSKKSLLDKNIKTYCKDFENWKTDNTFDYIIMSFYLHHINNFSKHIFKALSLLNDNGILIIVDRIGITEDSKEEFEKYWKEYYANTHEWQEECPKIFTKEDLINTVKLKQFYVNDFIKVPNDTRKGTENFPKTIAFIKNGMEL